MAVFLSLRTQFENLGDEVINSLMIREFCRRSPVVALGDGVPGWYLDNLRGSLGPLAARLKVVPDSHRFSLHMLRTGMGGPRSLMFTSCGDVSSLRSNYRRDGYLQALQHLPRMNLGLVGASFAAISPSKAWLLRAAQRRGGAISVRDSRSERLLAANGVAVPVVPDLAFLMPAGARDASARPLALFMLREVPAVPFDTAAGVVTRLAAALRDRGLTPAIAWQVGRDADFGGRLAGATGLPILTPPEQTAGRLPKAEALYRDTSIVFSNRLHGLLIAGASGALPVALLDRGESKVRGIFEDAGWGELIADANDAPEISRYLNHDLARDGVGATFAEGAARLRAYFDRVVGAPTWQG